VQRHVGADLLDLLRRGGYDPGRITVRHLLHHTSGLFDYGMSDAYQAAVMAAPGRRWSRTDQVAFAMEHGRPLGPPGTVFQYADTGYLLLGDILERATGLALGPALRHLLDYGRLGLRRTWLESVDPTPWFAGERAHQYMGDVDMTGFDPSMDLWGGGGMVATTGDLARFTHGLFHGRAFRRTATLDTMLTRAPAGTRDFRMGLFRIEVDGVEGLGHTGFWGTFAFHFPALGATVAGTVTQQAATATWQRMLEEAVRALRAR
jgi:D-alanyl-D-alanine carboxypeptidase